MILTTVHHNASLHADTEVVIFLVDDNDFDFNDDFNHDNDFNFDDNSRSGNFVG